MIVVKELQFAYSKTSGDGSTGLKSLSFECPSTGTLVVVGASGIGKSTLMALLSGIYVKGDQSVHQYSGSISVDGSAPNALRGPGIISWVPQSPTLLDHLSVLDNVVLPLSVPSGKGQVPAKEEARRVASNLLKRVGITDLHKRPRELSGGMMTRVSLVRALISKPKYLFLDEPFVGLDLQNCWSIYKLIRELRGTAVNTLTVLTTHNIPEAVVLADRILLLEKGEEETHARLLTNQPMELGAFQRPDSIHTARLQAKELEQYFFTDHKRNGLITTEGPA